jgi:hypothetical protein
VSPHIAAVPIAFVGPLARVISLVGFLAVVAWVAWRFGPTLSRLAGWCSWCVAWACGSQGGYGYCAAFLALGTLTWGVGTVWYANRRRRWPSPISGRLLTHVLGPRSPLAPTEAPTDRGDVVRLRRP